MELKIQPYDAPGQIIFNYEELKTALIEKANQYAAVVYTEDQMKSAKTDRANLNKLKKALNDERLKREREYMESFNVFKAQIAEIIKIIDKPIGAIDSQVKAFEERQREEKLAEIKAHFDEIPHPEWLTVEMIIDPKWANASVKMTTIIPEMAERLAKVENDLGIVRTLPMYAFEAEEVYKSTLDLARAVSESHILADKAARKAAWEAEIACRNAKKEQNVPKEEVKPQKKAEVTDEKQWVRFAAYLSPDDALALRKFFNARNIEYKSI